jgi:hypothetical protein
MKKVFLTIIFLAVPLSLHAETFSVAVRAGNETINAVEGVLILPAGADVARIYTGDSAVLIWITPPAWDAKTRTISFAGLSPGGFSRTKPLFALELSQGEGRQAGGRLFGYRNDGEGTQVALEYAITPQERPQDHEWPEAFEPVIFASPEVAGGRHVISFAAQDKGTGVERYEHRSYWLLPFGGAWKEAKSPHELSFAELFKMNQIRAYDAAGNYRESPTPGPYRRPALAAGSILIICVLLFVRRRFSRS